jgi:hypothetical protein
MLVFYREEYRLPMNLMHEENLLSYFKMELLGWTIIIASSWSINFIRLWVIFWIILTIDWALGRNIVLLYFKWCILWWLSFLRYFLFDVNYAHQFNLRINKYAWFITFYVDTNIYM